MSDKSNILNETSSHFRGQIYQNYNNPITLPRSKTVCYTAPSEIRIVLFPSERFCGCDWKIFSESAMPTGLLNGN